MKLGKINFFLYITIFLTLFISESSISEVKNQIILDNLEPTFEAEDDVPLLEETKKNKVKESNQQSNESNSSEKNKIFVNLTALDKITAKTSLIKIEIGKKKYFGQLEIKPLKCQLSNFDEPPDTIAYLQVRDLSKKDENKVFIFNGWTFASSPTLRSIDHPVYDLWLVGCDNI